jgi:hypothetical protein
VKPHWKGAGLAPVIYIIHIDRRSATFAALIFSTVDLMYRAKEIKKNFDYFTAWFVPGQGNQKEF